MGGGGAIPAWGEMRTPYRDVTPMNGNELAKFAVEMAIAVMAAAPGSAIARHKINATVKTGQAD